jgi:hypothetical protein
MALNFNIKDDVDAHDPNIDTSLTLNPPAEVSSSTAYESPSGSGLLNLEANQIMPDSSFTSLAQDNAVQDQASQLQQSSPLYTPAKLFQATGDVRSLARSDTSPSGFTVQIYDRHLRTWVPDINFSDIAIRGQLYILWKTAWLEHSTPVDREMVLDAANVTLRDIQKDNNKWERNYSAARRRDWHPHFTAFYDDIFKGVWAHRIWPAANTLLEPPKYLAEMARKLTKNAGIGAGTNIHQPVPMPEDANEEMSMSPVALRTLKLRVIELEGLNQSLREELGKIRSILTLNLARSREETNVLIQEHSHLKARFDEIRQKINLS